MQHRQRPHARALVTVLALVGGLAVAAPFSPARAVTAPTTAVVPVPSAASSLAFDDGRLLVDAVTGSGHELRAYAVTDPVPGQVTVGAGTVAQASTPVSTAAVRRFATSGGTDVVADSATNRVRVRRGATTLLDVPAPAGSAWSVDVSGNYVRIGTALYDLGRGAAPVYLLPPNVSVAAMYGSRLVWSEPTGTVRYRDLSSFAAARVLVSGTVGCTTCAAQVAVNGDSVAFARPGQLIRLWDARSGYGVTSPVSLAPDVRLWLTDGLLLTSSNAGVKGYRLNDSTTLSTGYSYLADDVVDLAVDGHAIAIARADGTVSLLQLPDAIDGPHRPILLGGGAPLVFSPNKDKIADTWSSALVLTQPVTAWTLVIRAPGGATVANFASALAAPATARVGVTWAPSGRPEGAYTWAFTGVGTDGTAMSIAAGPIGGTIALRLHNRTGARVAAPTDVATATRLRRTPLSWGATAAFPAGVAAATYDVQYRTVSISKAKRKYGKPKRVLTRTAKRSTTFNGARGASYQFRVRHKDNVGLVGPWSVWRTSNTPLDDRSSLLRYGKGWKKGSSTARWSGTYRYASKSKRTMTLTRTTSGFALVMRTCSGCGAVKVYVDGKLKKTVSLYSLAAANRKQVYSVSFKKLKKHTIKIVTVKKKKRPRVELDAVLVRH